MLDKNGVEIKVGDKFVGVKFSPDHPVGYADEMDDLVGKVLEVLTLDQEFHNSVTVDASSLHGYWWYPAELIEIIDPKVDKPKKTDTIKTSKQQVPKRVCWAVYGPEGVFFGAEETRRQARELNRSLGGGLQIFKMQAVKQSN